MATRNVGGHGTTSVLAGTEHARAFAAQPSFPAGGGMTDSLKKANSGVTAYKGGGKRNSTFPPAAS